MADSGKLNTALPRRCSDQRTWDVEYNLHRKRLHAMKPLTDSSNPCALTLQAALTSYRQHGKAAEQKRVRDTEIHRENSHLLNKIYSHKVADTFSVFRPQTCRASFYTSGVYYNSATQTKAIDHVNVNLFQSPRSSHYCPPAYPESHPDTLRRSAWPRAAPCTPAQAEEAGAIKRGNDKLMRALVYAKSAYGRRELERQHQQETELAGRIRRFSGPSTMRFVPSSRGGTPISASPSSSTFVPTGSSSLELEEQLLKQFLCAQKAQRMHSSGSRVLHESAEDRMHLLGDRPGVSQSLRLTPGGPALHSSRSVSGFHKPMSTDAARHKMKMLGIGDLEDTATGDANHAFEQGVGL